MATTCELTVIIKQQSLERFLNENEVEIGQSRSDGLQEAFGPGIRPSQSRPRWQVACDAP